MEYAVIVQHSDRLVTHPKLIGCQQFALLDVANLREAAQLAQELGGHSKLLKVRLTHHNVAAAPAIICHPRPRSIVSLIHDINLLKIADGILIDAADVSDELIPVLDDAVAGLVALGHIAIWHPWHDPHEVTT